MELEVLEVEDKKIAVLLKGLDISYANALRRFAISEVPTMAIHEVVILDNSSVIYDEALAHRLGLIPLTTPLDRYILPEECDCKSPLGCSRCRIFLALDAEASDVTKAVYSGELVSEDRSVRPVSDSIPLAMLAPGQKIKLEAYARLGKGKEHAKWQPSTLSVLKQVEGKEDEFILRIESTGALKASEILHKSAQILVEKLKEFAKQAEGAG